jgi:hypothetical protein
MDEASGNCFEDFVKSKILTMRCFICDEQFSDQDQVSEA